MDGPGARPETRRYGTRARAGPGDTGFAAAAVLGERGRLISTDFSPDMVEVVRHRGAELGHRNVDYRVMDGVLCRFGYMLMANPAAALAETRRVLRPGGRLALAVWGRMLVERGHMPPPEPEAPGGSSAWERGTHAGPARGRGLRRRTH